MAALLYISFFFQIRGEKIILVFLMQSLYRREATILYSTILLDAGGATRGINAKVYIIYI